MVIWKMNSLDLHGVRHRDVSHKVDFFIRQNIDNLPIEIVTGNSIDMQSIVRKVVEMYDLEMSPKSFVNLGAYIIK